MLAQNFKTASYLKITRRQFEALCKTLVLLETNKLVHTPTRNSSSLPFKEATFTGHFNMDAWSVVYRCGTVACIGGTAELVGGLERQSMHNAAMSNVQLYNLFYLSHNNRYDNNSFSKVTTAQAAVALRSYLTTGDARWDLAIK